MSAVYSMVSRLLQARSEQAARNRPVWPIVQEVM
jgi:hypothetical protein